jgi:apolipoprotein N-acyltransferase
MNREWLLNRLLPLAGAFAAAVLMLWFGTGLHPQWWLTWLAPLPLLWLATRLSAPWTFVLVVSACFAGAFSQWHYAHDLIRLPGTVLLLAAVQPALVLGAAVLLWRRLLRRGLPLLAALGYSGVLVAVDFAALRFSADSNWGSLAYTQMDFLPVLQAASLAGTSGLVFLVSFVPAALAAAVWGRVTLPHRLALAGGALALLLAVAGWGAWRLAQPAGPQLKVGLIASDLPQNLSPKDPLKKKALFEGYSAKAAELIAQGAQLVIVPEKIARVHDERIGDLDLPFEQAAARGAVIAVGVERWSGADHLNESRIYNPQGALWTTYEKHHMMPAYESDLKVGTSRAVLDEPSGKWGVQICKDMDFPALSRQYGNDGVGLVVVSAWDFIADGWLHDRMAVMRGVESGFSLARAAKQGLLTLSDDRGRVLAQQLTGGEGGDFSTLLGSVPVRHDDTLYARWGDWFAWLMLALLGWSLLAALGAPRP